MFAKNWTLTSSSIYRLSYCGFFVGNEQVAINKICAIDRKASPNSTVGYRYIKMMASYIYWMDVSWKCWCFYLIEMELKSHVWSADESILWTETAKHMCTFIYFVDRFVCLFVCICNVSMPFLSTSNRLVDLFNRKTRECFTNDDSASCLFAHIIVHSIEVSGWNRDSMPTTGLW